MGRGTLRVTGVAQEILQHSGRDKRSIQNQTHEHFMSHRASHSRNTVQHSILGLYQQTQ